MRTGYVAAILTLALSAAAHGSPPPDPCLDCHKQKTPGIVAYWQQSAHAQKQVGCTACHGSDVDSSHAGKAVVTAERCGKCHKAAFTGHRESRHANGLKTGGGCTRNQAITEEQKKSCELCHNPGSAVPLVGTDCAMFLAQSPEMRRQGCTACHAVEARCDTCHTKHGTDLALARNPGTCGTCHMGPDHPQAEMWATSRHGVLYKQKGEYASPSCATCHMRNGSHNVSRGISSVIPASLQAKRKEERNFMLDICSRCHTRAFSSANLDDADRIGEQSALLVEEARAIIEGLEKDRLLFPTVAERPAHPLFGNTFVISPHMLYENLSFVEAEFFKMRLFYAGTAFKGAFHQNPDYAHWYGNAPLKLSLSQIKSTELLLRKIDALSKRLDNGRITEIEVSGQLRDIKNRLRQLNEQRLKAEITEQEYQKRKSKLLDENGL